MTDDTKKLDQPNWGRERGKNAGKNKEQDYEQRSQSSNDGRGWHGEPERHAEAARKTHRKKTEALIEKSKRERVRQSQLKQRKKGKSSKREGQRERVKFVAEGEKVSFLAKKKNR